MMKRILSALLVMAAFLQGVQADAQQSLADFYRGKKLTLLIGYSAGGAYDLYARVLARHMGSHIPGNPTIVPQNMPGAGSLVLANYLYNIAPKDGTVFATFARGMAMEPLIGGGKTQFDSTKFTWLGSATDEISVCATTQFSKVRTYEDMLTTEFNVGGEGGGSDPDTFAAVAKNLLGAKIRMVTGYPGGNEIGLAIDRGELDGRCGWSWTSIMSTKPDWVRDKKLNFLLLMGLHRSPDLPDVPAILEKAKDDRQASIMKLVFTRQTLGRPFIAPPGLAEDRKAALRTAFDETMKDPDFLAEAKQMGLEISPVSGAAVDKIVADLYATPPDILAETRTLINEGAD
jgi:tripartite-type tricarboxylate transporter receptor subunit TctC